MIWVLLCKHLQQLAAVMSSETCSLLSLLLLSLLLLSLLLLSLLLLSLL
jgi:hypothetical protein